MEEGWQSDVKYKRLSIWEKTSKEINRMICRSIYHWGSSICQHSQTKSTDFNKNSPSCEYELSTET